MGLMDFFKKGKEEPVKEKQTDHVQKPVPDAGSKSRTYTIKSGDSLSKIAKQYYGDAGDWQKIYQANKETIKNPDMIFPGQKIIIP